MAIEKVNPSHPDKLADRIAGALVDYCYTQEENPKCSFEVLLGHGDCFIIGETSINVNRVVVISIVQRIAGDLGVNYHNVKQDSYLSHNQENGIKCGDNGIFKGTPLNKEIKILSNIARNIYKHFPTDGKYILDGKKLIICQSNASNDEIKKLFSKYYDLVINPLGYWTGGINVDSGATNRKLGSDMGEAVTGGGLHGKDLSKADVSINIYAHLKAQETGKVVNLCCAIGDETVDGKPYREIVKIASDYIKGLGGFEALACWGIV